MEPISAGLGVAQLIASLMNGSSASSIAQQNLQFQRDQAQKQERLGTAARVDANGNKQYYDPATNTWKTQLSPMQEAIAKAGESEQYRSLTEDAARNRQQRARQAQRAEAAVDPYNKISQEFLNNPTQSEGAIRNDISTLTSLANQDRDKGNMADVIRQSLRMGKGGSIPSIIKATNDRSGRGVSDTLLSARSQALQEHGAREQQRQSAYLPIIQQLSSTIDAGGGNGATRFSDVDKQLAATQNSQASNMLSAIQAANSGINSAAKTATAAAGVKPDFSGLFKALALNKGAKTEDWDKRPAKVDYSTVPDYLADISYGRTDSHGELF